jgi:uncharacterized protein (TIGR03435 family)
MISFRCIEILATAAFLSCSAAGQIQPERDFRFEVLSIRPMTGPGSGINTRPGPNGFSSRLTSYQAIMIAYGPSDYQTWGTTELRNGPNWLGDFYDFNARVPQASLKAWQNQSNEHELLRSAMRAALKERFHLAIHEQPSTAKIYELVVGKGGPRLKATAPNSPLPVGAPLPSGGSGVGKQLADGKTQWDYHAANMQDLAWFLTIASRGIPVRDRTGLTGRYDFTFRQVEISPDDEHVYGWPVDRLGLKIRPGVENRPILVIDHVEKPTPN